MASISTELTTIAEAVYGRQIRSAIHDAIEKVNTELTNTTSSESSLAGQLASEVTRLDGSIASTKTELEGEIATESTRLEGAISEVETELTALVNSKTLYGTYDGDGGLTLAYGTT